MLLRADSRYSEKDQLRRDDLRNHLRSLNNNSGADPDSSNVWDALPGSKWGSCTDLLTGSKSRPLSKALQPKSPKDEQRSFSYSYRAPVLALPPTLPLTKAPRQMESSELYENQRQAKQRARTNSFGGFSSQTLSSAPRREADKGFVGANNHVKMSRYEASPERCVVTLQRPESPCETKSPLPGTAQAHAQMLWIEKVRRGSEYSEYTGREPLQNNKAKDTYKNYQNGEQAGTHIEKDPYWNNPAKESYGHYIQEEKSRNNTKLEPHWNNEEKEQSWNDTNKKLHSNPTEGEPHYTTSLKLHLNNNEKASYRNNPENESHRNNVENEPHFNYTEPETRWNNTGKEPYRNKPVKEPQFSYVEMDRSCNNPEKELSSNNIENESQYNNREKYSSRLSHLDNDEPWNKPEAQPGLYNSEKEHRRNNKENEPSYSVTEKEQHWNNRNKHPYSSHTETESQWNITAKEPHRNGEERIQRWNNTDKEPHLNNNGSQWNNPEKESSWNKKMKEPERTNSEENQDQRPSDSAILPSRYTHTTSSAARLCNNQPSVEPTALYPLRTPLTQPKASPGSELRLVTSPLYKLSSFRYGSGRENPSVVHPNDPARTDDLSSGRDLSKKTTFDGKTTDSHMSGRTFRDRALSQGTLPRLLNKYLSGSANDLSRGYDEPRGSGERTLPRTPGGRLTSATPHGVNQVLSNTNQISDRWRTLDREDRTPNKYVTGSSVQTPSALNKTRKMWTSLDREGQRQEEPITRRTDQSSPSNAAQLTKARRSIFEPSDPVIENTFRRREDSSRPASCTPSKQTPRSSATGEQDRDTTDSDGRSRARSSGTLSPSSKRLYGSEMNLASLGSRQGPSYLAMTSSRNPSGRSNDQEGSATRSETHQSVTQRLSPQRLNQSQPSGTSAPHCTTSVQLKLMPVRSDFYSATSNGQLEDETRSTNVSSFNHVEPTTESSTGTLTYLRQCDSELAEPSVTYNAQGVGSEPTRPLGTTMAVKGYDWRESRTQMSDGNLTEDSGSGFSDNNIIRSSTANPRDDLKINRETMMDEGRLVRVAPVDPRTSGGSATLNSPSPLIGKSIGVSCSGYSEKDYVKRRRDEREEKSAKEIFTKEDWISNARMAGKSPTPVENKVLNLISDDKRTQLRSMEANAQSDRARPPVEWREQLDNMEAKTRSSGRSASPVEWRVPLDNMGANTRKDERAISNTEEQTLKQDLNSTPQRSTAAKWKEFLSGSVETDSTRKVQGHQINEWYKEGTTTIGESLDQSSGGELKVDPQWMKEGGSTFQLPVEHKEASRTTRTSGKESVFEAEDLKRAENRREEVIVSRTPLERISTSERSSVLERSNVDDGIRRGDIKIEDMSQGAKGNERNMENCNGGVEGLREVEIYVQRGALGVGFCVEGGMQSTAGDRPITIKRIFAGADGYLRGKLRPGDEILRVNDKDFRQMSHYNAWNFLKTLPEGPAKLLIFAK